ncbi:DUF4352 domain-containing protein [Actinomadura rupiterrae]|uniref:DUF4352 domain-containing protein n=1 Tax=Actinomadura rupiterrae TaxID=559627 RepID=UPI0020A23DF8|nr:DUF4352 domain-containing protein [Actinomadura rupiterrae]MCP2338183.1 hypothetical protein [Actinomadura rupiterrae]
MRRVRPLTTAVSAAVLLGSLQGCSEHKDRGYTLPAEKLREGERAEKGRTGRSSDMQFTVVAYTDGITSILGTHAEMDPHGRFARLRLLCVNTGRDIQVFDTWAQRLVLADGRQLGADVNGTMVKRQPERLSVGANMRAEFDLWFDVPKGAKIKSVRLFGSPSVGMVTDPPPADIPLP